MTHPPDDLNCVHNHNSHEICKLCDENPTLIRCAYIFGIFLWIAILCFINVTIDNGFDIILVCLPFILFIIGFHSAGRISPFAESIILRREAAGNIVIIIFPILVWATARVHHTTQFLLLVLMAVGLSIISLVDVWVTERYLSLTRHLRSICQVLSITLALLALVQYYQDRKTFVNKHPNVTVDEGEIIAAATR